MIDLSPLVRWTPSDTARTPADLIQVIDAHTGGEPFRVAVSGIPDIPGTTMLEKRRFASAHLDGLRKTLMWEPRGHADMYGCFLTEPVQPDSDLGVLFMHNEGYSTMCGHGIIALVRVLDATGALGQEHGDRTIRIDTPAGTVQAVAHREGDRFGFVSFDNVPSFVAEFGSRVIIPELGAIRYDLAFGGAFYAFVEAASIGLPLVPDATDRILAEASAIKAAVSEQGRPRHPEDDDLGFLYGVVFTGPATEKDHHSRHVCVFADGELDRSPTGTAVSARMALLHRAGEASPGRPVAFESIVGSVMAGEVIAETEVGPHRAIVPRVSGRAHLTGRATFMRDPDDLLAPGFLLRRGGVPGA